MKSRPLANQLAPRAGIVSSSGADAGEMIGGDITNAVAAGLDRVHFDAGELGEDVRHLLELWPVELDILAGREMAISAIVLRAICASMRSCVEDSRP